MNFFKILNENKISYCSWKSNEHLDASFSGKTDFDLLVDGKSDIENLLTNNNFIKLINPAWKKYPNVDDWLGLINNKTYHLHIHYNLATGKKNVKEVILPWKEICLKNTYNGRDGIKILEPSFELVLLLTRLTFKFSYIRFFIKGRVLINKDDLAEINYLKNQIDIKQIERSFKSLFDDCEINKSGINLFNSITLKNVITYKRSISKFYVENTRLSSSQRQYRYLRNFVIVKVIELTQKFGFNFSYKKSAFSNKGLIVSFIGCDGSGKSSVTLDVFNWINWKMRTKLIYLGNLQSLNSLRKQRKPAVGGSENNFIKQTLIDFRSLINGVIRYNRLLVANKLREKGFIVLTDRYPQNEQFGYGDGLKIKRTAFYNIINLSFVNIEKKLYKKMLNIKPDLVFKLYVNHKTALERKPDHSEINLIKKIELVGSLNFSNSRVYNINTVENNKHSVVKMTKEIIWKEIH